jgi:hypothetical protein
MTMTIPSTPTTTPYVVIVYVSGAPCTPVTYYDAACTCLSTSYVPLSTTAPTASTASEAGGHGTEAFAGEGGKVRVLGWVAWVAWGFVLGGWAV